MAHLSEGHQIAPEVVEAVEDRLQFRTVAHFFDAQQRGADLTAQQTRKLRIGRHGPRFTLLMMDAAVAALLKKLVSGLDRGKLPTRVRGSTGTWACPTDLHEGVQATRPKT